MRTLAAVGLAAAASACSVAPLSVDGKQCPCADDRYVCDKTTNLCLMANDGGVIIDTPAATSCIAPAGAEPELYRYAGTFDWQTTAGSWTGNATEIHQSSSSTPDASAYRTAANLTAAHNVHVIAAMREITVGSSAPSLGIVLREQLGSKSRYSCDWSSKDRTLTVSLHDGGNAATLGTATVPSGTLPTTFTMEAAIDGANITCCIREIAAAKLTAVPDPANTLTMGSPGLGTNRMDAAFGSFVVFQRP